MAMDRRNLDSEVHQAVKSVVTEAFATTNVKVDFEKGAVIEGELKRLARAIIDQAVREAGDNTRAV